MGLFLNIYRIEMRQELTINGMTCENCKKRVTNSLARVAGVSAVSVNLVNGKAQLEVEEQIHLSQFQAALGHKYTLITKKKHRVPSKWKALFPLFLIIGYVSAGSLYLSMPSFLIKDVMVNYMGLFFVVFSFFKLLDYKGFSLSFANYDPLAKRSLFYGQLYPFIESVLGLAFLFQFQLQTALWISVVLLSITSVGVIQSLVNKRKIQCACLGTVLKLPMTEATLIEDSIMLLMAGGLLLG